MARMYLWGPPSCCLQLLLLLAVKGFLQLHPACCWGGPYHSWTTWCLWCYFWQEPLLKHIWTLLFTADCLQVS